MNAKVVFSMRLILIIALISLPTYSAQADSIATEIERYLSTTVWIDFDPEGNTIYTQLDIQVGFNISGMGPGTEMYLSRTVMSPDGDFVYTGDSFFGHVVTTEAVFQADPKLKDASLAPVTFEGFNGPYTIQVNWTALDDIWGDLRITKSSFKMADPTPPDQYQIKYEGETASRDLVAMGILNGQSFENPSAFATISRYTTTDVSKGDVPYLISLTDYYAPTIQLGNKLMRGGEGYSADATWITQNSDGTTTEISLSIYDGFEQEFRLKYFYEGTTIYLSRIVRDEHGNYLSYENGGIYSTNQVVDIANNLDRAFLPPITITICSFWERDRTGKCINGEEMEIQAEWSGTEKLVKWDRWRFTEVTNCDDADCWTADFEHNFKIKVIGSGASRLATATAILNDVNLGPSTLDRYGQGASIFYIKEYAIQYGGTYPFNVFPIAPP